MQSPAVPTEAKPAILGTGDKVRRVACNVGFKTVMPFLFGRDADTSVGARGIALLRIWPVGIDLTLCLRTEDFRLAALAYAVGARSPAGIGRRPGIYPNP